MTQAQPSVPESPATPIAWVRLRLPSLGRDYLFAQHPGFVAVYWRMRDEANKPRPVGVASGDPRWRAAGRLLPHETDRNGGWSWGVTGEGWFWFRGSNGSATARAQHAEHIVCGLGEPPHLAEVWP